MRRQTDAAVIDADLSLFIVDARAGVTPIDETFARMLRKTGKPVVVVANKSEGRAAEPGIVEAYTLGFGDPVPISAEHGQGRYRHNSGNQVGSRNRDTHTKDE